MFSPSLRFIEYGNRAWRKGACFERAREAGRVWVEGAYRLERAPGYFNFAYSALACL